ncbi:DUF262 domain-containing protein [Sinorhizobium meliloti]|uniref:DUF262 domain-containing protein n=1 Tax=Rhizobium meliloti TaxID=382 RepID=UPI003D64C1B4
MFVQQNQYTIEKLVNRIRSGRLALPDFQRDFVWGPTQVADLLESISREWPIGSLLLLKGPQPFAFRAIDSAPDVLHPELDLYVLDGQQRVTAIFHAIQNVSQFVYYVDFNEGALDADEVIQWERRNRFEQRYTGLGGRARAGVALIQDICENENFYAWLDLISETSRRNEFVSFRERRLGGLQAKVYDLLAIELEQGIELEALAKIFETLNKTGVRLNAFDLLVAKLYPINFNLREEWETAKAENEVFSTFDPDGLEIIKLVALIIRIREGKNHSRGVRQGDVLSLRPQLIGKYWDESLNLYVRALEILPEFGVNSANLIPNWSMILGVVSCLITGMSPQEIRRWWLGWLRKQTFAQAANTRIVSEFDAIVQGHAKIDPVEASEFDEMLSLPARSNGLLLRGFTALVMASGARDPITARPLSEAAKTELCEIRDDGSLGKLAPAADFQRVVIVSDEGFKDLRKNSAAVNSNFPRAVLEDQGIDLTTMTRSKSYLEGLFQ